MFGDYDAARETQEAPEPTLEAPEEENEGKVRAAEVREVLMGAIPNRRQFSRGRGMPLGMAAGFLGRVVRVEEYGTLEEIADKGLSTACYAFTLESGERFEVQVTELEPDEEPWGRQMADAHLLSVGTYLALGEPQVEGEPKEAEPEVVTKLPFDPMLALTMEPVYDVERKWASPEEPQEIEREQSDLAVIEHTLIHNPSTGETRIEAMSIEPVYDVTPQEHELTEPEQWAEERHQEIERQMEGSLEPGMYFGPTSKGPWTKLRGVEELTGEGEESKEEPKVHTEIAPLTEEQWDVVRQRAKGEVSGVFPEEEPTVYVRARRAETAAREGTPGNLSPKPHPLEHSPAYELGRAIGRELVENAARGLKVGTVTDARLKRVLILNMVRRACSPEMHGGTKPSSFGAYKALLDLKDDWQLWNGIEPEWGEYLSDCEALWAMGAPAVLTFPAWLVARRVEGGRYRVGDLNPHSTLRAGVWHPEGVRRVILAAKGLPAHGEEGSPYRDNPAPPTQPTREGVNAPENGSQEHTEATTEEPIDPDDRGERD